MPDVRRQPPSPAAPSSASVLGEPVSAGAGTIVVRPRWPGLLRERRSHWTALLMTLLLHGVFVLAVWQQMRPPLLPTTSNVPPSEVLQIRFLSHSPAAPAPPLPALPPPPRHLPPPIPPQPVRKDALSLQTHEPPPPRAARLYDDNGQPLLPAAASSVAPVPSYVQRLPQGDPRIMQHRSPIDYHATRFDKDWGRSNAVDSALQKLVDKTTVKKTIRLPGGIRIHCGISLAMLAGGCGGDPPAPPSAKDGDERLSMAPARSLDGHPHAPKPPSEQACIAMYRAGKPLEWGCPVDTPNRAVDAELRARAAAATRSN